MKMFLTIVILLVSLVLTSCANRTEYYSSVKSTNDAMVAAVQEQSKANTQLKIQEREAFARSMTEASRTEDPTDNAVIAFAWGFATAQTPGITLPPLKHPEAPSDGVDYLVAGLPYANLLFPWLVAGGGGKRSGNNSPSISASDQATVYIDSGNSGSGNVVRDGSSLTSSGSVTNQHDDFYGTESDRGAGIAGGDGLECPFGYSLRLSTQECITVECEAWIDGGSVGVQPDSCSAVVQPVPVPDPGNPGSGGETCDVTGGYLGPDGRIYADPGFTCSCGSRAAGEC